MRKGENMKDPRHVTAVIEHAPKPSQLKQMRAVRKSCEEAGVSVPPEVTAFFREFPERISGECVNLQDHLRMVPCELEVWGDRCTISIDRKDLEDPSGRFDLISITFDRGVFDQSPKQDEDPEGA